MAFGHLEHRKFNLARKKTLVAYSLERVNFQFSPGGDFIFK